MKNKLFEKFKVTDSGFLDFFYKVEIINNNGISFERINQNARLDTLANEYYGTEDDYWIIPLVNNMQDCFFDMPLSVKEIEAKVLAIIENTDGLSLDNYQDMVDAEIIKNDEKKVIKLINNTQINRLLLNIDKLLN